MPLHFTTGTNEILTASLQKRRLALKQHCHQLVALSANPSVCVLMCSLVFTERLHHHHAKRKTTEAILFERRGTPHFYSCINTSEM